RPPAPARRRAPRDRPAKWPRRFVRDFPVTNPRAAFPVMTHQSENQLVPLGVIGRLDDVVIDLGKERARFEANAQERLRTGREDRRHRAIQCVEVITARSGSRSKYSWTNRRMTPGLSARISATRLSHIGSSDNPPWP